MKYTISKRWRNFAITGLGLLLLYACNGNKRTHADNPISQLIGRTILFEELLPFNLPEGATLYSLSKNANYGVIVYVDSSSCENCSITAALNIRGYQLELQEKHRDDIRFVYIFNTQDVWALQQRLLDFGFYHYYFVDFENTFLERNQIPSDKRFHTLLIDNENKVLVIGNPSTNMKIRSLYNKVLKNPPAKQ